MADFDASAVNAAAAMRSLIDSSALSGGQQGEGYAKRSMNEGANSVSIAAAAPLKNPIPSIFNGSGKGFGPMGILKQMGLDMESIRESFKKIAEAGGVTQCNHSDLFGGQSGISGGNFTNMVSGGSDIDIPR